MVTQLSFLQHVYGRQRRVGDVIERSYIRRTKVQIYIGVFQKHFLYFLLLYFDFSIFLKLFILFTLNMYLSHLSHLQSLLVPLIFMGWHRRLGFLTNQSHYSLLNKGCLIAKNWIIPHLCIVIFCLSCSNLDHLTYILLSFCGALSNKCW